MHESNKIAKSPSVAHWRISSNETVDLTRRAAQVYRKLLPIEAFLHPGDSLQTRVFTALNNTPCITQWVGIGARSVRISVHSVVVMALYTAQTSDSPVQHTNVLIQSLKIFSRSLPFLLPTAYSGDECCTRCGGGVDHPSFVQAATSRLGVRRFVHRGSCAAFPLPARPRNDGTLDAHVGYVIVIIVEQEHNTMQLKPDLADRLTGRLIDCCILAH